MDLSTTGESAPLTNSHNRTLSLRLLLRGFWIHEWYNVVMDETKMILSALHQPAPKKRRRKVMKELEPSFIEDGPDAILELSKKQSRFERARQRRQHKLVSQWSNADFLKYMNDMLSNHGLRVRDGVRDRDMVSRIYDIMVNRLQENMSNEILKEYFEWWVSSHAPFLHDEQIFIGSLATDHVIDKFLSRYQVEEKRPEPKHRKQVPVEIELDAETLFAMGGLPMVLCSKGIVVTCETLKKKDENNIFAKVSNTLRDLSEDAVRQALENTLKFAPYSKSQSVDFMSIARVAIEFHGLKDYKNVSYQDYFE